MGARRRGLSVLCSVAAGLALAGCGSEVRVPDEDLPAETRAACERLIAALPAQVDDLEQREVRGSSIAAAWGDPAIVLRCGVGRPTEFDELSACHRADGVDWFVPERVVEDQRADIVMTTIGRIPAVEVLVPARYRPTTAPMVDLAEAIKATTEPGTPCT